MPRGHPARLCGWGLAYAVFFCGTSAFSADLPGARLEVARGPGAASCPDAQALSDALRARLGSAPVAPGAPVVIEVEIRSAGEGFVSTVRASGGKQGVRTLSADGPTCDALSEALVVSLLVLLDRDPARPELEQPKRQPPRSTELSFWLAGGGAVTQNLPDGLSGALFGEVGMRYGPHGLWLGGIFTPERETQFHQGFVDVTANGGQLRACTLLWGSEVLRTDACALGLLTALRGQARAYTGRNESELRPWWLVGAGADLGFSPAPWLSAGLSARLLIAPKKESFSIEGLQGTAFETETAVGWLGLGLSVKIW
jgi:hypothetical protein